MFKSFAHSHKCFLGKSQDNMKINKNEFKKTFQIPSFNPKNKKTKLKSDHMAPVSVVDDLLKVLEKKDIDKKLKENE